MYAAVAIRAGAVIMILNQYHIFVVPMNYVYLSRAGVQHSALRS